MRLLSSFFFFGLQGGPTAFYYLGSKALSSSLKLDALQPKSLISFLPPSYQQPKMLLQAPSHSLKQLLITLSPPPPADGHHLPRPSQGPLRRALSSQNAEQPVF